MTISAALASAASGLSANARQGAVLADNLANALNPDFHRREVALSAGPAGTPGVRVSAVTRAGDPALAALARAASTAEAAAEIGARTAATIRDAFGGPGDPSALPARIATLERALGQAAADPQSVTALGSVLSALEGVAGGLNGASATLMEARADADRQIAATVAAVNDDLGRIEALNRQIARAEAAAQPVRALEDQRDALIARVNEAIPLRVVRQEGGAVALFAAAGAILLDGQARRIGFAATPVIAPGATLADGGLGGLSIDGRPISVGKGGMVEGGRLGALFAARDRDLPDALAALDALAADLATRLAEADPTLTPDAPGLLGDGTQPVGQPPLPGLAGRLAVNPAIDPDRGGALGRLRDGLGSAGPGDASDDRLLRALGDALGRPEAVPALAGAREGAAGHAAALAGIALLGADRAASALDTARAEATALGEALAGRIGVDSDTALQRLMDVENAYAANARVLATIDAMLQRLLEI